MDLATAQPAVDAEQHDHYVQRSERVCSREEGRLLLFIVRDWELTVATRDVTGQGDALDHLVCCRTVEDPAERFQDLTCSIVRLGGQQFFDSGDIRWRELVESPVAEHREQIVA